MSSVRVRCWKVIQHRRNSPTPDELFIAYPEENTGHDLIICRSCGQIYAVTIATEVYVGPPRSQKLKELRCVACGAALDGNVAAYPETYMVAGREYHFNRDSVIPDEADSIVKDFPGIYE